MSKSTLRYGKFTMMNNTPEASVQPSKKITRQWSKLDRAAYSMTVCKNDKGEPTGCCAKTYDQLTDAQKIKLHYEMNIARDKKATEERAAESMADAA